MSPAPHLPDPLGLRASAVLERTLAWERTQEAIDVVLRSSAAERAIRTLAEGPLPDLAVWTLLDDPRTRVLIAEVLESDGLDALLAEVLESRLVDAAVARALESEELWRVVEAIVQSPAVTDAITSQGAGFADQVAEELGERSRRLDARLERLARRLVHRRYDGAAAGRPRGAAVTAAAERPGRVVAASAAPEAGPLAFVGLVTRALAFALDAAVVNGVAVLVTAVVGLTLSVVSVGDGLEPALVAVGGVLYPAWTVGYFATFWAATGQTPGNRLLRIRVLARTGGTLPLGRAVLRFGALMLAAIPLFAGFLPILFDERRRGLHDRIAGSVVVDAPRTTGAPARGRERAGLEPVDAEVGRLEVVVEPVA